MPGAGFQEGGELGSAHGFGKSIALQDVAAQIAQDVRVLERLDAFADDLDAQRLADIDDGFDEVALRRRVDDRQHELAVDLQAPGLELHQRDDRGIAGAEIVDLDVDAQVLDLVDVELHQILGLIEEDGFHKLEGYGPGLDVKALEAADQPVILEAPGRDVDGDARYLEARGRPGLELHERLLEYHA